MDDSHSQFDRHLNNAPISSAQNNLSNNAEANTKVDDLSNILDQLQSREIRFAESNNNSSNDFMDDQHQQKCVSEDYVQTVNLVLGGEFFENV